MDAKEAIKAIKSNYPPENYTMLREGLDLAIEALEKQIPKRPIIKPWGATSCPGCGAPLSESLGDGYYNHWVFLKVCDCGQKLKWED